MATATVALPSTTVSSSSLSSTPRLILGSSSQYRRQLLTEMGLQFECRSADIDERSVVVIDDNDNTDTKQSTDNATTLAVTRLAQRPRSDPAKLTIAIAAAKARALLADCKTECLLITSDQVAYFDGEIREKPDDEAVLLHSFSSVTIFCSVPPRLTCNDGL
jgi:predicted house-cleaning NTP pyrophosphatase (Maf/HAM1 superfamily)